MCSDPAIENTVFELNEKPEDINPLTCFSRNVIIKFVSSHIKNFVTREK